jgi:hypothetical protein
MPHELPPPPPPPLPVRFVSSHFLGFFFFEAFCALTRRHLSAHIFVVRAAASVNSKPVAPFDAKYASVFLMCRCIAVQNAKISSLLFRFHCSNADAHSDGSMGGQNSDS